MTQPSSPRPAEARAYIDESIRVSPPGFYVLAAAIVHADQAGRLRDALRSLVPRGTTRFHWRNERPATRLKVCDLLVRTAVQNVVTVATPLDPRREERGRRLCLSRLPWELDYYKIHHLQFETRNKRDANDRHFLGLEQRVGRLPAATQYEFGQPNQEPLLWAADAVAGAVAAALAAGEMRYLEALGQTVAIHQLPGPAR